MQAPLAVYPAHLRGVAEQGPKFRNIVLCFKTGKLLRQGGTEICCY